MKETNNRIVIRDLLKQGFTKQQIVERMNCDASHVYRVIREEQLRSGARPLSVDKLARLEERVRQLEKIVAALSTMKRFGGAGVSAAPETPEARLQRLLAGIEYPKQSHAEEQSQ